jgi:hypothetical protein
MDENIQAGNSQKGNANRAINLQRTMLNSIRNQGDEN